MAEPIDQLDQIRAQLSDLAADEKEQDVLDLLIDAKDKLAMVQDLIEMRESFHPSGGGV